MPVWYASARDEHLAVVTHAGLFDTSHMATVRVFGPDAFDLLQWCFTRNLHACVGKDNAPLTPGKCVYGVFLDEHGHAIDDSIVYKITDEEYMVVVNAGMGGVVATHLEANREEPRRAADRPDRPARQDRHPGAGVDQDHAEGAEDAGGGVRQAPLLLVQGPLRPGVDVRRRRAAARRHAAAAVALGLHRRGGLRDLRRSAGTTCRCGRRSWTAGKDLRPDGLRPRGPRLAAHRRRAAALAPGHRPLDLHPPPVAVRPAVRRGAETGSPRRSSGPPRSRRRPTRRTR